MSIICRQVSDISDETNGKAVNTGLSLASVVRKHCIFSSFYPGSMNMGATAGIIAGILAGLLAVGILICCCCRKKGKKAKYAEGYVLFVLYVSATQQLLVY